MTNDEISNDEIPNDEIPNDEGMTKSAARMARCMHSRDALLARFRQSSLGIRASLGIRVSFVICNDAFNFSGIRCILETGAPLEFQPFDSRVNHANVAGRNADIHFPAGGLMCAGGG